MNGIVKTALRVKSSGQLASLLSTRSFLSVKKDLPVARNIWHMSASRQGARVISTSLLQSNHSNLCSCGCGCKSIHTKENPDLKRAHASQAQIQYKGERELVEFLTEEIVAERKVQKEKTIPSEIDGFQVKTEGAEVIFTKQTKDEVINVSFNINHTVDSEQQFEEPVSEKNEVDEMKSRPQFEVDIIKGDQTLSFTCSFVNDQQAEQEQSSEEYNDVFGIDEVTLYKGEWNDKMYAVAGDILDAYLYDLLMNLLEEKGISNEFAEKLAEFSTLYEHSSYISLLEKLSKFTIGK